MSSALVAAVVAIAARIGESVQPGRYQHACPAGASQFSSNLDLDQSQGAFIVTSMAAHTVAGGNNDLGNSDGAITMKLSQGGRIYVDKVHSGAIMLNLTTEPRLAPPEWFAPIVIDHLGLLTIEANQGAANNFSDGDAIAFTGLHCSQKVADLVRLHLGELRAHVLNLTSAANVAGVDSKQTDEDIIVDKFCRMDASATGGLLLNLSVTVDGFELFPRRPKTTSAIPNAYEHPGALVNLRVPATHKIEGRQETAGSVTTFVGFLGRTVPSVPLEPAPFPVPFAR